MAGHFFKKWSYRVVLRAVRTHFLGVRAHFWGSGQGPGPGRGLARVLGSGSGRGGLGRVWPGSWPGSGEGLARVWPGSGEGPENGSGEAISWGPAGILGSGPGSGLGAIFGGLAGFCRFWLFGAILVIF